MTTEQRHEQALITLYKLSKTHETMPNEIRYAIQNVVMFDADLIFTDALEAAERELEVQDKQMEWNWKAERDIEGEMTA